MFAEAGASPGYINRKNTFLSGGDVFKNQRRIQTSERKVNNNDIPDVPGIFCCSNCQVLFSKMVNNKQLNGRKSEFSGKKFSRRDELCSLKAVSCRFEADSDAKKEEKEQSFSGFLKSLKV